MLGDAMLRTSSGGGYRSPTHHSVGAPKEMPTDKSFCLLKAERKLDEPLEAADLIAVWRQLMTHYGCGHYYCFSLSPSLTRWSFAPIALTSATLRYLGYSVEIRESSCP